MRKPTPAASTVIVCDRGLRSTVVTWCWLLKRANWSVNWTLVYKRLSTLLVPELVSFTWASHGDDRVALAQHKYRHWCPVPHQRNLSSSFSKRCKIRWITVSMIFFRKIKKYILLTVILLKKINSIFIHFF